ncbi:Hsp20/alpha crystallin family protein [Salinibacillus xinjiangensis]|uniref:Hsp20 family protein n=1 Tax=Salinibacillus xinjiangensis TaxID=1229268 RepID=A0A6G1X915_9BACI|nr:Hsp20/alpha crystallin family protein [Salinibacillus xinjiangensis]MRG87396.1 Hsp20 family protein [Salinibacillus xinjiangensis]
MDPFKNMQDWKKNMDHFFGEQFWSEFEGILKPPIPQINMYQSDNEITVVCNVPGMKQVKSVDIFVDYATLEIQGVISLPVQGHLVQEEILQGAFDRKIDLPFPVRSDKIDAIYQNGLLTIQLYRLITKESNKHRVSVRVMDE